MTTHTIESLFVRIVYACVVLLLFEGCQSCNRDKITPAPSQSSQHMGIPNIGNTCYMNSCLQIIARLYPDLFSHMGNELGRYGQVIAKKITSEDPQTYVTEDNARKFYDALLNSYNAAHKEKLHSGAQADAAPVLGFLLDEGNVQRLELYPTTTHPNNTYERRFSDTANHEIFLNVTFPGASQQPSADTLSMDRLVASTLYGDHVEDFIWDHHNSNGAVRNNARAGSSLSIDNLHGLTNRILPIWVHRFNQTSNHNPSSAAKITTPITNPFTLTIAPDYLREDSEPYTSSLVGFILHVGSLNCGHYMAYLKSKADKWIRYDDETVTELLEAPFEEAQAAYLYFYQAD